MKKILALVMVLGVLGGVLVGCGSSAANNDAGATSSAAGDAKSS
jgi:hypothetical protein